MENSKSPYLKVSQSAIAGMIATLPMTIFMRSAWKRLPVEEKYALPPRLITRKLIKPASKLSERKQKALTLFLHFTFGMAAGLIYGAVEEKVSLPHVVKGPLAGMAVWTGSYLGWIPALGILPSAVEHPWRRNVLMIVAHLIWGLTLGAFARTLSSGLLLRKTYIDLK
jgi:uncharacterized membrane protein YagU involved in acid resistance